MRASRQGTLVRMGPGTDGSFDASFEAAVSEAAMRVEAPRDREAYRGLLFKLRDDDESVVVAAAPRGKAGPATDLLYQLRASGVSGTFVGYGNFRKDALAQLVRLGADDVLVAPVTAEQAVAALARASSRAASRLQSVRERKTSFERIAGLKKALAESEERNAGVRRLAIESLMLTLVVREADAVPHSLRVQAYATHLAEAAGYPEGMRESLETAALLHDIGKAGISEQALFRAGWLTQTELHYLEPHAEFGARIVERFDFLRPLAPILRHHHERFDGHGFPDGLVGTAIPLGARVFAIADSLDAMTSDKPYRAALTFEVAGEEIQRNAGKQFDPNLVEHFLRVGVGTWREIRERAMNQLRSNPPLLLFPSVLPFAESA